MEINYNSVSANRTTLVSQSNNSCPALLSSAWNFSSISEDIFLSNKNAAGFYIPFLIVPLSEGAIHVELVSGIDYIIQAEEVSASIGNPMMYLVRRIYATGTTVTNLTIGI